MHTSIQQPQKPKYLVILHIGIVLFGFFLLFNFSYSIYSLWKRGDVVSEREDYLRLLEAEQDKLKTDLSFTMRSEFIEEEARNKLNLVKPGETLVVISERDASDSAAQSTSSLIVTNNKERVMNQWVTLFVGN
jgi:cell division protein FtsB